MTPAFQITISGIVQGVGFRPFVYNLAIAFNFKGYVSNNEFGVIIIIQENKKRVTDFINEIKRKYPKKARITSIQISEIKTPERFSLFFIKPTEQGITINAPLTPDFAICKNCKQEVLNTKNSRYYYPFISCTACGPRYAIAEKFPFERQNTSMNVFKMCDTCLEEYNNPKDIRFHSQTNSCSECGIQITYTDKYGTSIHCKNKEILEAVTENLKQGKIIAVKNTSGYLLLCDATNKIAVQELRNRKKRLTKPFAVLFTDFKQIKKHLFCHKTEKKLLKSTQAPIVVLPLKNQKDLAVNQIAPNTKTIGAMLPNSGILYLISSLFQKPLVATSANFNGSPLLSNQNEAVKSLNSIADYYLHHNLEIKNSQDDSVIQFSRKNKQKIILRRARGLAPNIENYYANKTSENIICLGAALKNTLSITLNKQTYTSEYIGNVFNYDTYKRFENKIKNYQQFFTLAPQTIVYDKHPEYENNKIVSEFLSSNSSLKTIKIQHHEAHFAAILGEKNLWKKSDLLGVIWDGAGYGNETQIYGGEFFTYNQNTITTISHLEFYAWILGDKMALNPKISALAISKNNIYFQSFFDKNELKIYSKLIDNSSVKTSSMGRLFDAAAFTLGFKDPILFEGETGMYLENLAQQAYHKPNLKMQDYLKNEKTAHKISAEKLLLQIVTAVQSNIDRDIIALNFHYTLVKCIEKTAIFSKSKEIAFSGGVFQNTVLIDLIIDYLEPNFKLHFHEILSPNDENISFGQLNHYLHLKK